MKIGTLEAQTPNATLLDRLRKLENPFLRRELRQLSRRPRGVQFALFACMAAMALVVLGWLLLVQNGVSNSAMGRGGPPLDMAMTWLLVFFHMLLCGIASAYGCYRLFSAEQLRSTFELTQLLPYSPLRWLLLKLAFPGLGILVSWLAGFPFYYLAWLCNLIPQPGDILFLMHKPLLVGLSVMLFALLATPEYMRRAQQRQARMKGLARGQRVDPDIELELWSLLYGLYIYALVVGCLASWGVTDTPRPFYRMYVPEALYWFVGFALLAIPAFLTGYTALVPQERWEVRAHRARLASLVLGYYLFAGLVWGFLPFWYRVGILALPLVRTAFALATRAKREKARATERPANLQSEREVQWVVARYPNALLMRDLRVYSRLTSIQQCFLWTLGLVMLVPLGWLGITMYGVPPRVLRVFQRTVPQLAVQLSISIFAGAWGRPAMQWHKERAAKTLPLLLITPMTSREMLLGRLMASPIYQMAGQFPLFALVMVGVGWALQMGYWMVGPILLGVLPLAPAVGVWTGCQPAGPALKLQGVREWGLTIAVSLAHLLLIAGTGYQFVRALAIGTSVGWGPPLYWGLGLLMGIGHALLIWAWFEFRVRQLDKFRHGDMEILDTQELKPLRPQRHRWFSRARKATA